MRENKEGWRYSCYAPVIKFIKEEGISTREGKMSAESKEPASEGEIKNIIKILEYLNYDATINLNGVDPALVFQWFVKTLMRTAMGLGKRNLL